MRSSSLKMWLPRVDAMRLISLWLFVQMYSPVKMQLEESDSTESDSTERSNDQVMKLHHLTNASVTCNDGSPAGYYIKESKDSKRWLVYLQGEEKYAGGLYCFDKKSCDARYTTQRELMSSNLLPRHMTGNGILSTLPEENPHWWNANIVLVPYCSSDSWTGASAKTIDSDYAFMGSLIVREVVNDLLTRGLYQAKVLLLAGSSSGSIGVMFNIDRITAQLKERGYPGVKVRGLADSGWFLNIRQYTATECTDILHCDGRELAKKAFSYWGTKVQESCSKAYVGEEWRCFSEANLYPTLKSPVFLMQYRYDSAQLSLLNTQLGPLLTEDKMTFIKNMIRKLERTLKRAPGMFVAACLDHMVIQEAHWKDLEVQGTSLPQALHCWERSLEGDIQFDIHRCAMRLVDRCRSFHCNPTCLSRLGGQNMSAVEYLKTFGIRN